MQKEPDRISLKSSKLFQTAANQMLWKAHKQDTKATAALSVYPTPTFPPAFAIWRLLNMEVLFNHMAHSQRAVLSARSQRWGRES